jgi:hypothetical protein
MSAVGARRLAVATDAAGVATRHAPVATGDAAGGRVLRAAIVATTLEARPIVVSTSTLGERSVEAANAPVATDAAHATRPTCAHRDAVTADAAGVAAGHAAITAHATLGALGGAPAVVVVEPRELGAHHAAIAAHAAHAVIGIGTRRDAIATHAAVVAAGHATITTGTARRWFSVHRPRRRHDQSHHHCCAHAVSVCCVAVSNRENVRRKVEI